MRRFTLPARERLMAQRPALLGRFRLFGEVVSELRKVSWPSQEETKRLTTMVVIVAVAMGIIMGIVDEVYSRLMDLIIF